MMKNKKIGLVTTVTQLFLIFHLIVIPIFRSYLGLDQWYFYTAGLSLLGIGILFFLTPKKSWVKDVKARDFLSLLFFIYLNMTIIYSKDVAFCRLFSCD